MSSRDEPPRTTFRASNDRAMRVQPHEHRPGPVVPALPGAAASREGRGAVTDEDRNCPHEMTPRAGRARPGTRTTSMSPAGSRTEGHARGGRRPDIPVVDAIVRQRAGLHCNEGERVHPGGLTSAPEHGKKAGLAVLEGRREVQAR